MLLEKEETQMDLNDYQQEATKTAEYPHVGANLCYPAMGLAGEAGEVCDKIKKRWRNTGTMSDAGMPSKEREDLVKECGDVLWYLSAIANEMGTTMSHIAEVNLEKLRDRKERGVIKSSGDNR